MFKTSFAAVLLACATASFAEGDASESTSAPARAPASSAPKKHRFHAPRLRPGAKPAENPEASADKKGGA